jgi:putative DNA primase/helicase
MKLILYTARCTGNEKNCSYPDRQEIGSPEELIQAIRYDHVCAEYKNNHRSSENFISSYCVVMDCDNDDSEDEATWITPEALKSEFDTVSFAVTYSRHHMKQKDTYGPRPRFHVYFVIPEMTDPGAYTALKIKIQKVYPFFDGNALDAGRFIYGCQSDDVVWHDGVVTIDAFLKQQEKATGYTIPAGKRNSTMSKFAGRVVKRYGHTEEANQIFLEEAAKCDPPLDDEELSKIWSSAKKWEKKVSSQSGYVPPDQFNAAMPKEPAGSLKPQDYSDIGQAKILSDEYGDELRYSEQTGYLHYDGISWEPSVSAAIGATEEFLDLQLADAELLVFKTKQALINAGVGEETLSNTKKAAKDLQGDMLALLLQYMAAVTYHAFVMQRRNMRYINSAMQAAQPMVYIKYEDLDNEPFLLNTPGATYDLRDGLAGKRDHNPEDYMTKVTMVEPGKQGEEIWQDTLQKTFQKDLELIDYVQAVMGLAVMVTFMWRH